VIVLPQDQNNNNKKKRELAKKGKRLFII